jgi:small conductance mechanosensitive channel
MPEKMTEAYNAIVETVVTYGLDVLGAIVILVIGLMFAGWAQRATHRTLGKVDRLDETLRVFFGSIVKYLIIILVVLAVLNQFGVQTTSLIALLGAAGLAIGLALQGTLSNVAAGVMLLIFRPFKVGDYIDAGGQAGTVRELGLFTTHLNTPDNVRIIVPNGSIWGQAIKNFSFNTTRRVDLLIGIAYGDDIGKAMASIESVIASDDRIHGEPAPMIAVSELADSSVNLVVRVWCDAGNYWPLKFDLTKAIKERLDTDGISIPFPQRDVHLFQEKAS